MHYLKMMTPLAFALAILASCADSTGDSKEKSEINQMDSTSKAVKDTTEKLEDQTKKVEASLEKLEKEFDTTKR